MPKAYKRLAFAVFTQAFLDLVDDDHWRKKRAMAFLHASTREDACMRAHWLAQAGLGQSAVRFFHSLTSELVREAQRAMNNEPGYRRGRKDLREWVRAIEIAKEAKEAKKGNAPEELPAGA